MTVLIKGALLSDHLCLLAAIWKHSNLSPCYCCPTDPACSLSFTLTSLRLHFSTKLWHLRVFLFVCLFFKILFSREQVYIYHLASNKKPYEKEDLLSTLEKKNYSLSSGKKNDSFGDSWFWDTFPSLNFGNVEREIARSLDQSWPVVFPVMSSYIPITKFPGQVWSFWTIQPWLS